ncbi:MAG: CBS domain-containing protein [Acidobacteria bacterium]|nr:CBS domain-containing protein [Acidobacteriota bacterium]
MATVETVQSILKGKGGDVWSLPPSATVFEALGLMAEKSIGALVVVSEGQPVGVLSERDYARKVFLKGKSSKETLVGEIMTSPVMTVEPRCSVLECMRIMTANRVRHLPVLDQGRLAGIVSIGDLVNSIISAQAQTIQQLRSYVTGEYPA